MLEVVCKSTYLLQKPCPFLPCVGNSGRGFCILLVTFLCFACQITLGLLLSNDIKAKKIVLLLGKGNTGKSVFGSIVRELIADNNVTSFPPQKLKDRFIGTKLVNASANICMDLPSTVIDADTVAILKNLSGGDLMCGEQKYMSNFEYIFTGHLLFGSNYPVRLNYLELVDTKEKI